MVPFVEVDGGKLRELEAEARRRGLTLSQALEQAIDLWLSRARDEEREMNNAVYQRMKGEIFSRYRDKYVVIAKGEFVGAYGTLEEVQEALRRLNVGHAIVFNPSKDAREEGEWLGSSLSPCSP